MQNIQSLPNPFRVSYLHVDEKAEKRNKLGQKVALTVLSLGTLTAIGEGFVAATTFSAITFVSIHIVITGAALITAIVAYKMFTFIRDINESLDGAPNDWRPLHQSAAKGQLLMIRLLLFLGADPNKTSNGDTPLHMACFLPNKPNSKAHIKIMELLVKAGADVNAEGNWGRSPLHYALDARHVDRVLFLVEHGAYINLKQTCNPDWSPLEYAIHANAQVRISGKIGLDDPRTDEELLAADKSIYKIFEEKGQVYTG